MTGAKAAWARCTYAAWVSPGCGRGATATGATGAGAAAWAGVGVARVAAAGAAGMIVCGLGWVGSGGGWRGVRTNDKSRCPWSISPVFWGNRPRAAAWQSPKDALQTCFALLFASRRLGYFKTVRSAVSMVNSVTWCPTNATRSPIWPWWPVRAAVSKACRNWSSAAETAASAACCCRGLHPVADPRPVAATAAGGAAPAAATATQPAGARVAGGGLAVVGIVAFWASLV